MPSVLSIRPLVGIFHNHNPLNLDSSDQQIHVWCDLNVNLDYESVDLPLEVDYKKIRWSNIWEIFIML